MRYLEAAAQAFERVATLDVDFVPEVLTPLLDCYARLGQMQRAERFLVDIIERSQGVSPVIAAWVGMAVVLAARLLGIAFRITLPTYSERQ